MQAMLTVANGSTCDIIHSIEFQLLSLASLTKARNLIDQAFAR